MSEGERDSWRENLFARARSGDAEAFGDWAALVELPLRRSVARFARWVDLEVVVQETLLRMWLLATMRGRELTGPAASLRFAQGIARNVALEELRRGRVGREVELESLQGQPEEKVDPEPQPDPGLRRAILGCIEKLPGKPRKSLLARLSDGHRRPDRDLAQELGMKLNTFLQNIVRARRLLAECLELSGVGTGGVAR